MSIKYTMYQYTWNNIVLPTQYFTSMYLFHLFAAWHIHKAVYYVYMYWELWQFTVWIICSVWIISFLSSEYSPSKLSLLVFGSWTLRIPANFSECALRWGTCTRNDLTRGHVQDHGATLLQAKTFASSKISVPEPAATIFTP